MSDRFSPIPGIESAFQKEFPIYTPASREEQLADIKARLEAKSAIYKKMKFNHVHSNQDLQHELRHRFQSSLNKLNSLETRNVGIKEARQIIERNVSNEALKVFLGSLGEIKKVKSPIAREQEVLLIGWVANIFRDRIEEDGLKTVTRMVEMIADFFNDLNRPVHEAAASALCEVYENLVPKNSIDVILGVIYDPLEIAMTSGINTKSQQAAALSVFKWVEYLISQDENEVANSIYPRVLSLYCKLRAEFPDLISALGALIDFCGIDPLLPSLLGVIKKSLQYLQYIGPQAHLYKIEACKLFSCLAKHLQNLADLVLEPFHSEVLLTLQDVKTDKLAAVQNAARQAYNDWKSLEEIQREIEERKMIQDPIPAEEIVKFRTGVRDFKNYEKSPERVGPNNFKAIRELAKRNKQMQGNIQKANQEWGVSKSKFLEKGSGNYIEVENEQPKKPVPAVNKRNVDIVPNIVPREGINRHVMEVIQRSSVEAIPKPNPKEPIIEEVEREDEPMVEEDRYQSPAFKFEQANSRPDLSEIPRTAFANKRNIQDQDIIRQRNHQQDIVINRPVSQPEPVNPMQNAYQSDSFPIKQPFQRSDVIVRPKPQPDLTAFTENIKSTFVAMQKSMDKGFNAIEQRLYQLDQRMDEAYNRLENVANVRSEEEEQEQAEDIKRSFVHPPLKQDNQTQSDSFGKPPQKTQNSIQVQTNPINPKPQKPIEEESLKFTPKASSSTLQKQNDIDPLSKVWIDVLNDLSLGKVEEAYLKVLNTGDDIYLLRLMHKTGACLSKMSLNLCKKILSRLGMILNSGFLEGIGVDWLEDAIKENMLANLGEDEKRSLGDAMERISQLPGEEAISASNILNSLSYL